MCGIFGYSFKAGALSEGRRAILGYRLAEKNDARGGHSWGCAILDGGLTVKRGLGQFRKRAHELSGAMTVFGHTRWATHGEKTVENAHPFEIGSIVGAHNGIIYNHGELCETYDRPFAVDSMHIFAHLDEGRALDDLEGYGAIEWVSRTDPGRINLARLDGGDLAIYGIGTEAEVTGIAWSSDAKDLESALRAAGLKQHFAYKVDVGQVYQVADGELRYVPNWTLQLSQQERKGRTLRWEDYLDDIEDFDPSEADDSRGNALESMLDRLEKEDYHGASFRWPPSDGDERPYRYFNLKGA